MPSPLIEIPAGDIFQNDRLGLEPAIRYQSQRLLARSPQAIAIDGSWGSGKSTFVALWTAYLQQEGAKVISFNAWKSSLSDPLDALTKEILRHFDGVPRESRHPAHKQLVEFVLLGSSLLKQGAKLGTLFFPNLSEATDVADSLAGAAEAGAESLTSMTSTPVVPANSQGNIDSPDSFAAALSQAAKGWSDKPVVIMVDELDRCSPEYAVEMLQLLEHVFYAENVVFVVSMNRDQLIHSVGAFYGQGFNAVGYLERFFDDVFPLPSSNRTQYIESRLAEIETEFKDVEASRALPFLEGSELSLREIDRAVGQLADVLQSYAPSYPALALISLWLARTLVPIEYRQFMSGGISDKALAEAVFSAGNCRSLRKGQDRNSSHGSDLEAMLILTQLLCNPQADFLSGTRATPLYAYHDEVIDRANSSADDADRNLLTYAISVVNLVNNPQARSIRHDPFDIMKAARILDRDAVPDV